MKDIHSRMEQATLLFHGVEVKWVEPQVLLFVADRRMEWP